MGHMWSSSFYGIIFLKIDNWELVAAGKRSRFSPFRRWICWSLIIKEGLSVPILSLPVFPRRLLR